MHFLSTPLYGITKCSTIIFRILQVAIKMLIVPCFVALHRWNHECMKIASREKIHGTLILTTLTPWILNFQNSFISMYAPRLLNNFKSIKCVSYRENYSIQLIWNFDNSVYSGKTQNRVNKFHEEEEICMQNVLALTERLNLLFTIGYMQNLRHGKLR